MLTTLIPGKLYKTTKFLNVFKWIEPTLDNVDPISRPAPMGTCFIFIEDEMAHWHAGIIKVKVLCGKDILHFHISVGRDVDLFKLVNEADNDNKR